MNLVSTPVGVRSGKLVSLQYIRAIGAILVVLSHTGWTGLVIGQSGVDLFFVVSGFVMMLVSGRERSPIRFVLSRWARIVPLYWAVTLLIACIASVPTPKLVASLLFWPASPFPVVIQGWSLDLEMAYYAFLAVSLLGPRRWRVQILAAEMFILCVVLPALLPHSEPVHLWSNPLAFEFLTGAALYGAWVRGAVPTGGRAWLVVIAGAAALVATHFLGDAPEGWVRVVAWGMPALAIVMGSLGIERGGQLPRVALLERLGEASYSIYLTHLIALGFVAGLLGQLWTPVAAAVVISFTCAVGWAVYRYAERPLDRLFKRMLRAVWTDQRSFG